VDVTAVIGILEHIAGVIVGNVRALELVKGLLREHVVPLNGTQMGGVIAGAAAVGIVFHAVAVALALFIVEDVLHSGLDF